MNVKGNLAHDTNEWQNFKDGALRNLRMIKIVLMSAFLLVFCSWLMVTAALAEDGGGGSHNFDGYGIIYGPTSTGTDDFGAHGYKVGCYAPDRYYAAYLLCSGNNANFDVVLSDEQKAFLSNASTGGGFYDLAQKFTPDAMPIYVLQYGEGNTWFAEYNNHDLDAAIETLHDVLNGNVGGGSVDGYYYYDTTANPNLSASPTYDGVAISSNYIDALSIFFDDNSEYGLKLWISVKDGSRGIAINALTTLPTFDMGNPYGYSWPRGIQFYNGYVEVNNLNTVEHEGKTYLVYTASNVPSFSLYNGGGVHHGQSPLNSYYFGDLNGSVGVTPPTNWPETPQNPIPTEPDVPIHTGRGNDDLPEPSDYIEQPTYVTNVFTADLQGVIDALDEHCQHLQDAMYSNFQGIYDDITDFLWQLVQWLGSNINDMLNDLCDYFHDLFEWLAEQFDFSVSGTGYNDNTVVSWLRKIYARLGSGTNTRPTDPVADPFDFGEWLSQLFGNFVAWLFGLGSDAVSGLVEDFQTLITKFPFSIPWDLGAMLALLVTAPVTPVIEFPCYTFAGGTISQVGTYRIDMSAWDDVMNTVRPMEVLVFAFWLAFKVDFFKGIVELNKN